MVELVQWIVYTSVKLPLCQNFTQKGVMCIQQNGIRMFMVYGGVVLQRILLMKNDRFEFIF